MLETYGLNLLLALLLGAAIGLERQSARQVAATNAADSGIRTFSLAGLLGCLAAIFYVNNFPLVFVLMTAGFVILLCSHYVMTSYVTKDFGLTTEISFILTFLIGAALGTNILPFQLIVAIAVVIIVILSLKSRSEKFLSEVSRREVESFISFAILGLVILPFLSDRAYTLADVPDLRPVLEGMKIDVARFENLELINPQKLWFIVVLITGIDVLGYVLSKFVGPERGFTVTSFVGGFVSSTVTTQTLAQKSKSAGDENYLVGAAILANQASFFQIFLLVGPLNRNWLIAILPTLIIMIVTATALSLYFLRQKRNSKKESEEGEEKDQSDQQIFSIIPALQFAGLLTMVKIVTNLCLILFGKAGFVLSSIIASLAGIDAILVNLAGMAGSSISFEFALFTFILVNATNLLAKSFYCYLQGSRSFTLKFLISAAIIIAMSFTGFLFI
jgi:uncharacterized membrane protein (DUF4010 family)